MTSPETPPRLFPLDFEGEDGLYTGTLADGTQVFMGWSGTHLVAYFFEPDGALKGGVRQRWKQHPPGGAPEGDNAASYRARERAAAEQSEQWRAEVGLKQGLIRVRRFSDGELGVGIEELPGHLQDLEWAGPEAREELEEDRENWFKWGLFVLYWGKDYFMNAEGTVDST